MSDTIRGSKALPTLDLPIPEGAKAAQVDLLANVISCVMDESLLERVGSFTWTDSELEGQVFHPDAVPVNRWERACVHFWDTLFSAPVSLGPKDAERLRLLVEDLFKAAGRCRAGEVCFLMDRSVWNDLKEALSHHEA